MTHVLRLGTFIVFCLEGYKFQLLEEGKKLVCSGRTFLLDNGPRTIRIAKDGTIESRHSGPP
jgi:hypothetical protein